MIALPPAQMAELYQQVCHAGPIALEGEAACVLFFAFCDGHTRAQVFDLPPPSGPVGLLVD